MQKLASRVEGKGRTLGNLTGGEPPAGTDRRGTGVVLQALFAEPGQLTLNGMACGCLSRRTGAGPVHPGGPRRHSEEKLPRSGSRRRWCQ